MSSRVSALGSRPLSESASRTSLDELVGVELARGDVDRHADLIAGLAPCGALPAGLLQHPLADLYDQAGLLQQRDEVVGLDDPARRAAPPDQRLHAGGAHVPQIERRLVDEEELVPLQCDAQVHLELHPALDRVLHHRLEHDITVLPVPLRAVHRDVRVTQQIPGREPVPHRDPDARRHGHGGCVISVSERERLLERFQQPLGDELRAGRERQLFGDHDELIAPETPERVGGAHDTVQSRGYRPQQLVPGVVTERVVDGLEVVQVDEQRRDRRLAAARAHQHLLGAVQDQGPVRQPRKRVVGRHERELLLAPAELLIGAVAL